MKFIAGKQFRACVLAVFASVAMGATKTMAAPATLTQNYLDAIAEDDDVGLLGGSDGDVYLGTVLPALGTLSAQVGNSSSSSSYDFSTDAVSIVIAYNFEHAIDNSGGAIGGDSDHVRTSVQQLRFTTNVDASYEISGIYSLAGPAGTYMTFAVWLDEIVPGGTNSLLVDQSISSNTANESFQLGVPGDGDGTSVLVGSLTGNLVAGRQYEFSLTASIASQNMNFEETFVAAAASGDVALSISAVPLPSPLLLLMASAVGVFTFRRRP